MTTQMFLAIGVPSYFGTHVNMQNPEITPRHDPGILIFVGTALQRTNRRNRTEEYLFCQTTRLLRSEILPPSRRATLTMIFKILAKRATCSSSLASIKASKIPQFPPEIRCFQISLRFSRTVPLESPHRSTRIRLDESQMDHLSAEIPQLSSQVW